MNKKVASFAILLMLVLQTLFSAMGFPVTAMAEGVDSIVTTESSETVDAVSELNELSETPDDFVETKELETNVDTLSANTLTANEIKENILTSVVMKDKDGNVIHAESNPDLHPALGSEVEISFTWALKNNHGYKEGDFFSFYLPNELVIYNDIDPQPLSIGGGDSAGSFTVSKEGKVTMTFNSTIETHSNVGGTLKVWTEFSEQLVGSVTKEIIFPVVDDQIFKIPVVFLPKPGKAIDKKGVPNKAYNAEEIDWTVDFNKQLAKIDNAVLKDPIQTGQALKSNSIKVYYLDVQLDGSVKQGNPVDPQDYVIGKLASGDDFQLSFKTNPLRSAYRVTYTTTITDGDKKDFLNEATLTGDTISDMTANATVTVSRGTPLEKKSTNYNGKTQTIDWLIHYNWNEKTIAKEKSVLTDYFDDSQMLLNDSFKVYQVTIDDNGKEVSSKLVNPDAYTINMLTTQGKDGFELKFNNDLHEAYKILYQTKAKDRVFVDSTITNTVVSGDDQTSIGKRVVNQGILIKTHKDEINYKNKTTKWEMTFNNDEYHMNQVTLTDLFPNKGLMLLPNTLKIERDVNGVRETLIEEVDYKLIDNGKEGFEITFLKPIKETHYISYQTEFNYDDRANEIDKALRNKATLYWKDEAGKDQTKEAAATFTPDAYTQGNGFKNGSYNAVMKEITWNIGVNYNLKTIDNPVVEDYLLSGQVLVPDSLKVYEMELTGGGNGTKQGAELTAGKDYVVTMMEDKDGNSGWRISFMQGIDTPYFITYKTSIKDKLILKTYKNTAVLLDGVKEEDWLEASVTVKFGGEYVNKNAVQDNKLVNWTVNINRGQSQLSNVKIVDTPSSNQILLEDSFHLYPTKVAMDGSVTVDKTDELKHGEDYRLEIKTDDQGNQSFVLEFLHPIDSAYILEYQSFINAGNGAELTNKVELEGDQITTETTESTEKITVKLSAGSGIGSGETGSLEVTKVDAASGEVLKGAVFTLYDSEGKIAIRSLTTGDDGKATFVNLLFNDYILKEDQAPQGYVVGINNQQQVTVNAKDTKVTINNKKIIRAVELKKIDNEHPNETIKGAKFALFHKQGNEFKKIAELETDENGIIFKDQLEPGEYKFVEIKAPFGYQLDETPQFFTIGEKQTEKVIITMENQLSTGAVELVKVDKDHGDKLSGARFTLLDADGKVFQEGLVTDDNGKLIVKDLKPGDYQFVETNAPFGYVLDATPIKFTIDKGQEKALQIIAKNELTTGSVELIKVDKENQALLLADAEFDLQDAAGKTLKKGLVTDKDGKLVVKELKPGDYQFVEAKAPFGYDLNTAPIPFTIEKGQTVTAQVTALNLLTRGAVELTKIDKDQPLLHVAGAEFELQDANGMVLQKGLVTDANGKLVVKDLKPGNYQFIETKAPFGYDLDATPIKFTIDKGQEKALQITAKNELTTGSVNLIKVDKENPTLLLADAEYELQDAAGKPLKKGLVTDKDGKIIVKDLKPGDYQFIETKAPIGYELDKNPITFTIEKAQTKATEIIAVNVKKKSETVDKTVDPADSQKNQSGSNTGHPLANTATNTFNIIFVGALLLLTGTTLLLARRRNKSLE